MTDTGKHSALRQTDDGSFEITFEDAGLHEISEDDRSVAELAAEAPRPARPPTSKRVIAFAVGGLALLLVAGVAGWLLLGGTSSVDQESDAVTGFKAYRGAGAKSKRSQARKSRPPVAPVDPAPEPEVEPPAVPEVEVAAEPEPAAGEITEDEPGWELAEGDEETPDSEEDAEDETPKVGEGAGQENTPAVEPEDSEESGESAAKPLNSRRFPGLSRPAVGRGLRAPRIPALSTTPLAARRLNTLPIRTINPVLEADDALESDEE